MIISVQSAYEWNLRQDLIFVDCRFDLQDPEKGKVSYAHEHIPGAVYMDLEKDLSGEIKETGGRHPLPDLNQFLDTLKQAGINDQSIVIAYDDNHAFASRFVWLLKAIGHEEAYVLDGGLSAWKEAGLSTTDEVPINHKIEKEQSWRLVQSLIATQSDVQHYIQKENVALIDSRSHDRYTGQHEPIDKKAGHIPTALNYDWTALFENGFFKHNEQLQKHFEVLNEYSQIVVYCGSGVTAAPNVIALWQAGFSNVLLYVGSFSDWITNDSNQIKTGNQP
ncbi:sulfurtransferase [Alkalibacillus sp. S2W]|uniref:sulfurtransferase n=1 Tax=Alkalibacillus sp. S2W TaxID=3386553 RepID=UPI00398D455A